MAPSLGSTFILSREGANRKHSQIPRRKGAWRKRAKTRPMTALGPKGRSAEKKKAGLEGPALVGRPQDQ
jgi:hypothetical protein